jgi:hypothetical protein
MTPAKTIAPPGALPSWIRALPLEELSQLAVPMAVLGIVIALITPLPSFVLDLLIVTDILMSVTVLMVALYLVRPVEFTSFPTTLLLLTLFRLALNISSSRLILLNGNTGTSAAGEVIGAFGSFVVGGNYIIGAVIFLVLIAIQYVVINHGAVRISEVTARFTLDALPGKQMSIDSDLNAGLIDETEAKRRRKQLATEAEFYGAMDGASRFTQRDAVASILITGINIVAGFLIGVLQHGMDFRKRIETYTVLTIGDGLVTVIPALMISISGGLIVTRASSDARLGAEFHKQIFGNSRPCCWRREFVRHRADARNAQAAVRADGGRSGRHRLEDAPGRGSGKPHRRRRSRRRQGQYGSADARRAAGHRGGAGAGGAGGRGAGFRAAAAHFLHSQAIGHRTRLYAATGSRHRQPPVAQPRVPDFAQGRGNRAL